MNTAWKTSTLAALSSVPPKWRRFLRSDFVHVLAGYLMRACKAAAYRDHVDAVASVDVGGM